MTTILLWDSVPGEVRYARVENGVPIEFRIVRPRIGPAALVVGAHFTARVLDHIGGGKAKVSLGGSQEAILEYAQDLNVGALQAVHIVRAPIPEPGRWKLPLVRAVNEATFDEARWHADVEPFELALHAAVIGVDYMVCGDVASANAARSLLGNFPKIVIDPNPIAEADFDSVIDQAISGEFPIAGGMLSIERTRAMTVIDIDGSGDAETLNHAAAMEIPRLLRLLGIGGQIGIDFLASADRAARQRLDAKLAEGCAVLGSHERTSVNGFGFAQLVLPRHTASIPEMLCGITPGRLSIESRATALLRDACRSVGVGPRTITAAPAVIDLLRRWPDEIDALKKMLGTSIDLVSDATVTGYGHVHVKPS